MAAPQETPAGPASAVISRLVRQFDHPLDFYRELVQNAIDAGSNRVDVSLDRDPDGGVAYVRVEDDGEGMDRRVIDESLLVLFRSTKEGDLTKIGKFGIGIISVFAFEPHLVRIHTGKGRESWRLDFADPEHYERFRVDEPREGTLVELLKGMSPPAYARLVEDSRKALRYWCRHADARVYFQDRTAAAAPELVSEPFGLPHGESLRHEEEGTEVVMGFSPDPDPFFGFYNRGLTLKEGRADFFPGLEFKIRSRYLEHTLARDDVLADADYRKALGILRRLAEEEMPRRLRKELPSLAREISSRAEAGECAPRETEAWLRRLPFLRLRGGLPGMPVFPCVDGHARSLEEVRDGSEASGRLLLHEEAADRLTRALARSGAAVLVSGPWVPELVSLLGAGAKAVRAREAFHFVEPLPDESLTPGMRGLLADLRSLDAACGRAYRSVLAGDFSALPRPLERVFVTQEAVDRPCPASDPSVSSLLERGTPRFAVLNPSHPFLRDLELLRRGRPGLAALLGLKVLRLNDGEVPAGQHGEFCNLAEKLEAKLLRAALDLDIRRGLPDKET